MPRQTSPDEMMREPAQTLLIASLLEGETRHLSTDRLKLTQDTLLRLSLQPLMEIGLLA
jgi:hypothetical protein